MAKGRRHRGSSNKPKSKRTPRRYDPAVDARPMTVDDVPDHILELILLRLHSPACVLRAAATCKRWHRLVADTEFLSWFGRTLTSRPCIAGNYHTVDLGRLRAQGQQPESSDVTKPAEPVFLSSSSSHVVDCRQFSLDFLPDSETGWEILDSHGSLLLLTRRSRRRWKWNWALPDRPSHWLLGMGFPDLVVCEPLTRRYQGILRAPTGRHCLGVFLLDGNDHADGGRIGMSNFRIVSVLYDYIGTAAASVFSWGSDDGGWGLLKSDISIPNPSADGGPISFVRRANGCIYWALSGEDDDNDILVFEEDTMEFSCFLFPKGSVIPLGSYADMSNFRIIAGEDGALRVICVVHDELKIFVQLDGAGGKWVLEKHVQLWEAARGLPGAQCEWRNFDFNLEPIIIAATGKFVLVTPQGRTWPFSVELETLKVERHHERNKYPGPVFPYELPWPPVLNACIHRGRRRR